MSIYEQLEDLIKDIKTAREDINGTDLEHFDFDQMNELANECLQLLPICNNIAKLIKEYEEEK